MRPFRKTFTNERNFGSFSSIQNSTVDVIIRKIFRLQKFQSLARFHYQFCYRELRVGPQRRTRFINSIRLIYTRFICLRGTDDSGIFARHDGTKRRSYCGDSVYSFVFRFSEWIDVHRHQIRSFGYCAKTKVYYTIFLLASFQRYMHNRFSYPLETAVTISFLKIFSTN